MRAIFRINAALPPMDAEEGLQLHYTDEQGVLRGGYARLSDDDSLYWIEASAEVIAALEADPAYELVSRED